jgi:hypothetical protein
VSQYEALVTKPSQSNPLIKSVVMVDTDSSEASSDVYMTPEGSKYKQFDDSLASELGVHSCLSEPHVTQLMQMQAEKDSLNEEIHSLHLSYLSLQSTGDANEKLLKESKVDVCELLSTMHVHVLFSVVLYFSTLPSTYLKSA